MTEEEMQYWLSELDSLGLKVRLNEFNDKNEIASPAKLPTREDIKKLTVTDIAIMNELAYFLRDSLKKYISIDPFTALDPFGNEDDYIYSIIVDIEEPIRIIAMVATKKDPLPQIPWNNILDGRLIRLSLSRLDAAGLKYEMMPKDTNNFYPYRRSGKIEGYVMFAFQICGRH